MAIGVLLRNNFKAWVSARGFVLVLLAGLLPLILTGAWVATHQSDVVATELSWDPQPPTEGENVTVTARVTNEGRFDVGEFNATITVGRVSPTSQGVRLIPDTTNTTLVPSLKAGESTTLQMTWKAKTGFFVVIGDADSSDTLAEIEEFNNQKLQWMEVRYQEPNATAGPTPPGNLTGPSGATAQADLSVLDVSWTPENPKPNDNVTMRAVILNEGPADVVDANLTLRAGQVFSNQMFASRETKMNVSIPAGASREFTLQWNSISPGPYWVEAFVNLTNERDPIANDNHLAKPLTIHISAAGAEFPDPPERLTIKEFYFDILNVLYIRILLPLIGLFYAAGVLADDKEKGNLVYILTRPVPRPLIPIIKFVASFLVASIAVIVGIVGTFFLLLGTPQNDLGFLTTPLLMGLFSLFVYGAFFILLGVLVERPYLIGLAWVIGWEAIAGSFVPWVQNLTLSHHLLTAFEGWWNLDDELNQPLMWLPEGEKALVALGGLAVASIVFLALSVAVMRSREFDV